MYLLLPWRTSVFSLLFKNWYQLGGLFTAFSFLKLIGYKFTFLKKLALAQGKEKQ
jgi:hypothetical protein